MADCRILIVDDDPLIRSMVSDFLQLKGYRPICAANGAQALTLTAVSPPDLILLDIWMRGLTGWDVVRELRARGSPVPIVVMTSGQTIELRPREVKFDGYIEKPFTLSELLASVERFCPPAGPV